MPRRILAVRHGESEWNVLRRQHPEEKDRYAAVMYTPDCSLTEKGIQQSRDAGVQLSELLQQVTDYVLVVSPLRRALQTALHLLNETCGDEGSKTCSPPRQILVHPACAEILKDACDLGTTREVLETEFPQFYYELLPHGHWWAFGKSVGETWQLMRDRLEGGCETDEMVQTRLGEFREYLCGLKVDTVVVVCHSEVIWWLTSKIKDGERFGVWTSNGEVLDISEHVLPERKDTDQFQGGCSSNT